MIIRITYLTPDETLSHSLYVSVRPSTFWPRFDVFDVVGKINPVQIIVGKSSNIPWEIIVSEKNRNVFDKIHDIVHIFLQQLNIYYIFIEKSFWLVLRYSKQFPVTLLKYDIIHPFIFDVIEISKCCVNYILIFTGFKDNEEHLYFKLEIDLFL